MPAVIQPGGSRTESRFAKAARFDEPDDVMPMSGPLRQQFEHAVIIDRFTDQRPADQSRKVIIADADRVRVAVGALHRLGGGPDPDTRHRAQLRTDHPVLNGTEFHRAARLALHGIVIDFAQARRDRAELREFFVPASLQVPATGS